MATSRDTPNPLRPYYRPPSIGNPIDTPGTTSSGTHGLGPKNGSAASYASSARDMFSELDYGDYLSDNTPTAVESVRKQVDDWFYKYTSILLAQPFDVAKLVLQVRSHDLEDESLPLSIRNTGSRQSSYRNSAYSDYPSDDSDPDEPAYFTATAPLSHSYSPPRSRRRHGSENSFPSPPPKDHSPPTHQLILKRPDSILEVISQEWTKEGGWGVWKGSNTTFVYSVLVQTLEKWSRGLLSALLNVPDPDLATGLEMSAELIGSPYPWASLGVAIAAAVATGLILAPLDLIRTKLILTPTSHPKRSLTSQLRMLPSYLCPTSLIVPTVLHSLITPAISHTTPLLLRSRLAIDPFLTPNTYQLARFMSKSIELFIKLPLETVLRRGQMAVLKQETSMIRELGKWEGDLETMVKVGNYRGVVGTMWLIVRDEGVREVPVFKGRGKLRVTQKEMKGQGLPGLWRGWRVGMWGLVGMWSSRMLSGGAVNGGEF
ncbi:mitochondrial fusion protein-like protein [Hyaloscypha sp. PMI_1271]|nr:mitochondrial fusion protein-like protein [Hyaloscypha sp. PMI_1271]